MRIRFEPSRHRFLSMLIAGLFSCLPAGSAGAAGVFTKPSWTPNSICAALAWREGRLRNCSYWFVEDCRVVDHVSPTAALSSTSDLSVKVKNGTTWIELSVQNANEPTLNIDHSIQTWDGSRCTWLERHRLSDGKIELHGGVKDAEPPILHQSLFFSVVGTRHASVDVPWSKWIEEKLAVIGTTSEVEEHLEGEEHCVTLQLAPGGSSDRFTFTFLPDKDFAIRDYLLKDGGYVCQWHVSEFKKFDGFWMPTTAAVEHGNADVRNTNKCVLKSFSLAPPSDKEMAVDFPVGTLVADAIAMRYYLVLSHGTRQERSFYDPSVGKVIQPTTTLPTTQP